jgi:hypothetical protein
MRAHQRGIGTARQHHKTQRQMISQSTHEGPDRGATKTRTIRTLTIPLMIRRAVVRRISTAFLPRMLTPSRAGASSLARMPRSTRMRGEWGWPPLTVLFSSAVSARLSPGARSSVIAPALLTILLKSGYSLERSKARWRCPSAPNFDPCRYGPRRLCAVGIFWKEGVTVGRRLYSPNLAVVPFA